MDQPLHPLLPESDEVTVRLADYAAAPPPTSDEARATARLALMDAIGCGLVALEFPACARWIGPVVPGAVLPGGARVLGTAWELDPLQAAFCTGAAIRWLDYNDTWLAAEWGHPSDNLGAILPVLDWIGRAGRRFPPGQSHAPTVRDALGAMIQAYEIQGLLALENAFNRAGMDHVVLVRVASAAVVTRLLGGGREEVLDAVCHAWIDGGPLRVYRHPPNVGPRKSWAAGDAARRGVQLALWALAGPLGSRTPLATPRWGFQDSFFREQALRLARPLGSYVMENVLFKVAFPAEFHGQTAVEADLRLAPQVRESWDRVTRIDIQTHDAALRIIDKTGPLANPADRDHCLQYMVAVALLRGGLTAADYEDAAAADPRIDRLRAKTTVTENPRYSRDYLDPDRRAVASAVQVFFDDGRQTERVEIEYPLGHRRRRAEAEPLLQEKFRRNACTRLPAATVERLLALFTDPQRLDVLPVGDLLSAICLPQARV